MTNQVSIGWGVVWAINDVFERIGRLLAIPGQTVGTPAIPSILETSTARHSVLVLDASTGQNALSQAQVFTEIAGVTGLIMTKLDGTARGGILVALAAKFGLPIHAIGVGEGIEDLQPFTAEDFASALVGFKGF